jgi:hypothetical protein
MSKFMAYPILFLMGWVFSSALRIYEVTTNDKSSDIWMFFAIMDALCLRMQGALNVLVYVIAPLDTTTPACCLPSKKSEEREPLHANTEIADQF